VCVHVNMLGVRRAVVGLLMYVCAHAVELLGWAELQSMLWCAVDRSLHDAGTSATCWQLVASVAVKVATGLSGCA
jgi:hypothetical protein